MAQNEIITDPQRHSGDAEQGLASITVMIEQLQNPSGEFMPQPPNESPTCDDARIVIVGDDAAGIRLIQQNLKRIGFSQLFTATDAERAMGLIQASMPDVVLVDVVARPLKELRILGRLRGREETVDLPVIVLAGENQGGIRAEAFRLGARDVLNKPVDVEELDVRLGNLLVEKAQRDRVKDRVSFLEGQVAARSTELMRAYEEVIHCLAKVGEYRDNDTGRHVVRVGRYAEIVARQLGMEEEFVKRIRRAAPLHDIGKVGISDLILLKHGKLDHVERRMMEQHCVYGKSICSIGPHAPTAERDDGMDGSAVSRILQLAASIAFTHHEKWDGTGYPRGMSGEQIPIEGRITAVADVFDALTSKRPYKDNFSVEHSLEMMEKMRGTHFDPTVLEAFFSGMNDVIRVYYELADSPPTATESLSSL